MFHETCSPLTQRLLFAQLCWEILNYAHGQELSRCLLLAEEAEAGGENQITLHLSHTINTSVLKRRERLD